MLPLARVERGRHTYTEKNNHQRRPDGGDGGRGGHVIFKGDSNLWTLWILNSIVILKPNTEKTEARIEVQADGQDCVIRVPLGTVIVDNDSGEKLTEIIDEEEFVAIRGGKGGRGNWHFKSPTNQTPRYAQSGLSGESAILR